MCITFFSFSLGAFYYYLSFSIEDYPAKEDLIPVLAKIKDYEVKGRRSKRESLYIDYQNGVDLLYSGFKPGYHIVKNLLSKGEEVVFYVDKTGEYRNRRYNRLYPLLVENQGAVVVSYEDFIKGEFKNNLGALVFAVIFLICILVVIFEYFWVKRKYERSLLVVD